jgi:starch synthase
VHERAGSSGDLATANGFVFEQDDPGELAQALRRAVSAWRDPAQRLALQHTGMAQDLSWATPARAYASLYGSLLQSLGAPA